MRNWIIALAGVWGMLGVSSQVGATPLFAGGSTPPDGLPETGTILMSPGPVTTFQAIATNKITGSFQETVFTEAAGSVFGAGTLDFVYQVTITKGDIGRLTADNFGPYLTDVSIFPTATGFAVGTIPPLTADRTSDGDVVGFNFAKPPLTVPPAPAYTTFVMIIRTNATTYAMNDGNVIDGSVFAANPAFGPAGGPHAPTPEPSTLVLLGGLAFGLGGMQIRRLKHA